MDTLPKDPRTFVLRVRLTGDEKAAVQDVADIKGLTPSAYARMRIREIVADDLRAAGREVAL